MDSSPAKTGDSLSWSHFKKWWIGQDYKGKSNSLNSYGPNALTSAAALTHNSAIGVIDIKSMKYIYLSPNFGDYLGWQTEDFMNGGVEFSFSTIHPDDKTAVLAFSELINSYFKSLPVTNKPSYHTFWDYRLSNNNGYYKVIQRDSVLKYDENGKIEEFLFIVTKIGNIVPDHAQHLRMTDGVENVFYKYDHKLKENMLLEPLSKREMEVAKLIAKSMSLKEIAAHLNISFNTVKVNSANMLDKLKVCNSLEMVNLLRTWGFI